MYNKLILLFALFMIGGFGSSNLSKAEDFNFTVPVQANNLLPEVYRIGAQCGARSEGMSPSVSGGDIGRSEFVTVSVPDTGNVSANINVKFNALAGKDPNDAVKYICYLRLVANLESGGTSSTIVPNENYLFAQPKPGTVFVGQVSGDIQ